ncbi:PadR family transcription regulator [Natronomonas pharaonis DSM 2160]|uniref:PadR family transcription regulator n=1 Tax=Natronomonas pharaonis (strain ATCC 35678 / DSM 2160 / CIP 103997 / JCM 8858 / NBRC 14720 / NCIMB 2260 / Gabara) TaxID=348780 RepID=A0A1U7EYI5_NATPD|nr:helix-turn-helix transcriptional regulator [Natronomonas pharaonis]CAI50313.1 PadR family transcription regulator [Natronomonas pharaonis DSM 2160]
MSSQGNVEPTLERLVTELGDGDATRDDADPAARTEAVVTEASETLFEGGTLHVDDGLIKQSLPELLLLLVGLRSTDTHGKGIMEDLSRFFGAQLSPGTVYPMLHDLEADDLLEMRELVQTKEYTIDDTEAVRGEIQAAMQQHLALGLVFSRALDEIDVDEMDD